MFFISCTAVNDGFFVLSPCRYLQLWELLRRHMNVQHLLIHSYMQMILYHHKNQLNIYMHLVSGQSSDCYFSMIKSNNNYHSLIYMFINGIVTNQINEDAYFIGVNIMPSAWGLSSHWIWECNFKLFARCTEDLNLSIVPLVNKKSS